MTDCHKTGHLLSSSAIRFTSDISSVDQKVSILRRFVGDKWTRLYGSRVPIGTVVEVVKFYPLKKVHTDLRLRLQA